MGTSIHPYVAHAAIAILLLILLWADMRWVFGKQMLKQLVWRKALAYYVSVALILWIVTEVARRLLGRQTKTPLSGSFRLGFRPGGARPAMGKGYPSFRMLVNARAWTQVESNPKARIAGLAVPPGTLRPRAEVLAKALVFTQ